MNIRTWWLICATVFCILSNACLAGTPTPASDSLPVTADEVSNFLSLVCRGSTPSGKSDAYYAYECNGVIGYDNAAPGETTGLRFLSIIKGSLTAPGQDEAYVTYHSGLETHEQGFGGGILFRKDSGVWKLVKWYPGAKREHCLALPGDQDAEALCLGTDRQADAEENWIYVTQIVPDQASKQAYHSPDDLYTSRSVQSTAGETHPRCFNVYDPDRSIEHPELNQLQSSECETEDRSHPKYEIGGLDWIANLKRSSVRGVFAKAEVTYHTGAVSYPRGSGPGPDDYKERTGHILFRLDGHNLKITFPSGLGCPDAQEMPSCTMIKDESYATALVSHLAAFLP